MLEVLVYIVLACWALTALGLAAAAIGALRDQSGRQWRAAAPADPAAVFVGALVGAPLLLLLVIAWSLAS